MKHFYWLIQNILWPFMWIFVHTFYTVEIRGRENIKLAKSPLIIASNHKTLLDGFLVMISLPWFSGILPGRYMAEEIEFNSSVLWLLNKFGLLHFFYRLTGGFPSKRGEGIENAMKIPLEILQNNGTILMFPEGQLVKNDSLGIFYHGTTVLAMESNASILPIAIRNKKRHIIISIDKPFKLNADRTEQGTTIIREKIQKSINKIEL